MHTMECFVQSAIFLLILTAAAVFSSGFPYLIILFSGILMVLVTIRSLEDEPNHLLSGMQLLTAAAFALLSGNVLSCLVFYECRGRRMLQICLPPSLYFVVQVIVGKQGLPDILCGVLLLLGLALALYMVEHLIVKYMHIKSRMSQSVSVAAQGEMFEKKLNQELVMKNYLADRNARLEERENISRNIHNSVGHSLTAAIMALEAADMLYELSPGKARGKVNAAKERIHTSLDSIRRAVRVLDEESAGISIRDFVGELEEIFDEFMLDTRMVVYSDFSNADMDMEAPREHTEFLTGAVQELLANGVRHGNADTFTVSLVTDSCHIKLKVCDNGKSDFSQENAEERIQRGFGLKKLISYAGSCGGEAYFENRNGFCAVITLKQKGKLE